MMFSSIFPSTRHQSNIWPPNHALISNFILVNFNSNFNLEAVWRLHLIAEFWIKALIESQNLKSFIKESFQHLDFSCSEDKKIYWKYWTRKHRLNYSMNGPSIQRITEKYSEVSSKEQVCVEFWKFQYVFGKKFSKIASTKREMQRFFREPYPLSWIGPYLKATINIITINF